MPSRRKTDTVRVAVIGVGNMGANHARVLSNLKRVELVGVVDPDLQRARHVGDLFDCRGVEDYLELGEFDAVTVAAPSSLHTQIGCELLAAGIHCLIEKPLATDLEGALSLVAAAEASAGQLLVGHIERFNPAVRQLKRIVAAEEISAIAARRMSAVSARITDVDVVADLMVHDLDIVSHMLEAQPIGIVAQGTGRGDLPDHVNALLSFPGGRIGSLTASRITQNRIRTLEVTTSDRFFVVDYSSQELLVFRQGRISGVGGRDEVAGQYALDVGTERVMVRRTEPLVDELTHFIDVAQGKAEPEVSGEAALAALRQVWEIQASVAGSMVG